MLKRLVILAVLTAAMSPMPGWATQSAAHGGDHSQAKPTGKNGNSPSAATVAIKDQPASGSQGTSEVTPEEKERAVKLTGLPPVTITDKPKTIWDRIFDWGPWIFNFGLLLVGAGQVWLLWKTWKKIGKQAELMETQTGHIAGQLAQMAKQTETMGKSVDVAQKSADAAIAQIKVMRDQASTMKRQTGILEASVAVAQRSAEAFVNSERARLAVIFTEPKPSVFQFHAKNSGRSPAMILFFTVRFLVLEASESLPWTPDYLDEEEDWLGGEEWVQPNESANLEINGVLEIIDLSEASSLIPPETRQSLETDKSRVYFYGYVRYRDSISNEDKFTRFRFDCFWTGEGYFLLPCRSSPYCMET
jgi:hypothetical protein